MNPLVSITIPVYNTAPYLRRCLDSVLAQTIKDWEAMCIDDGSSDDSGAILDEYAKKDGRFIVVHQKNGGESFSRQRGLDISRGKWIASVDSDDWIDPDFLEKLLDMAESSNVDMVWCDFTIEREVGKSERLSQVSECDWNGVVMKMLRGDLHGSLCNKLYRREFIVHNDISHPVGRLAAWEDIWFTMSFLSRHPRLGRCECAGYHYFVRAGSATHSRYRPETLLAAIRVQKFLESLLLPSDAHEILAKRKVEAVFNAYSSPDIPDDLFYSVCADVKSIGMLDRPLIHRFLFWFASRGFRRQTSWILRILRRARG